MPDHMLFYVVFLCQILLVSFLLPRRIVAHAKSVSDTYPPSTYPKLYPRSMEHYARSRRNFRVASGVILFSGLVLLAVLLTIPRSGEWDHVIAAWYFMVQCLPVLLLDLSAIRETRAMREAATTRRAELRPRRLFDFLSPTVLGLAIAVYAGFVLLVAYVQQFDYPWFGGYWNVLGITIGNLVLAGIALRQIYGKKLNPHQAHEDRVRSIKTVIAIQVSVSIAATSFVALNIALSALDLREYQAAAQSLYFQLLAAISLRVYLVKDSAYEVYREDPAVT